MKPSPKIAPEVKIIKNKLDRKRNSTLEIILRNMKNFLKQQAQANKTNQVAVVQKKKKTNEICSSNDWSSLID